jgi:predicted GH43/DUF377 family glycosyl hydrolase
VVLSDRLFILKNPVQYLGTTSICYHEGNFHLYFTVVKGVFEDRQAWFIGHVKTQDFILFDEMTCISPEGYGSPGNVFLHEGQFVICYQSYPRKSLDKAPGDECRLFFSYSDDLERWGDPEIVSVEGCRSNWGVKGSWQRRQIDPYVLREGDTYYLFYKGGYHMGLWASEDLRTWRDLTPDKPLLKTGPESWSHGVENPCVIKVDERFYMFYDSTGRYEGRKEYLLHYITSPDLANWDAGHTLPLPRTVGAPFIIDLRETFGVFIIAFHCGTDRTDADRYLSGLGIGWSEDFRKWKFLEHGEPRVIQSPSEIQ